MTYAPQGMFVAGRSASHLVRQLCLVARPAAQRSTIG